MPVIAALDGERQPDVQRIEQIRRPWAERNHDIARIERAARHVDPPMRLGAMQRPRVALQRNPAERGEARRVGAGERQRIAHAHRAGPMHSVFEYGRERRFERARGVAVERHVGNAELRRHVAFARLRGERFVAAVELEPAVAADVRLGAGFVDQRLVLGDRAHKKRPHQLGGLDEALGPRRGVECGKPRRDLRQKSQMVVGFRRALERDAKQCHPIRRKGLRKDGVAFDNAGIAVGGPLPRTSAVDQRNRKPALDEMQRDRGSDDAGSQHDDIGPRHSKSLRCGHAVSRRGGRVQSGYGGCGVRPTR